MPNILKYVLAAASVGYLAIGAGPAKANLTGCYAVPGNIVQDCGFEAGSSGLSAAPDWTFVDAASGSYVYVAGNPNTGNLSLAFGAYLGEDDTVSQTLTTTPGEQYTFSFFISSLPPDTPNAMSVSWDATTLVNISNDTSSAYTEYTYTVTGTGSDTISFSGMDSSAGYLYLDDVSVAATVPEPASLFLLGAGLAGVGAIRRRRR